MKEDYLSHQLSRVNPKEKSEASSHTFGLLFCFVCLSALGLLTLYSASYSYFLSQVKHFALGTTFLLILGFWVPLRFVQSLSFPSHLLLLFALLLVLLVGHKAGGGQRWLSLFGLMRFQPSEFIKITTVLFLAHYFYEQKLKSEYYLMDIWPIQINAFLIFVLVFVQPDFGTAGLCLGITICQLFFVPVRMSGLSLKLIFFTAISTPLVGWLFLLKPYQKQRVLTLLNPGSDPTGSGYNSLQSLVAIGSGGFTGRGFLQGSQTQLHFLPARHTDFIFSVFSEEFGFVGCLVVFALFFALFLIGFSIARESTDLFKKLTAVGITSFLFLEFFINIAMVLGVFPVVGMALPFFSSGGSSVLAVCLSLGLLISIDRSNRKSSKDKL